MGNCANASAEFSFSAAVAERAINTSDSSKVEQLKLLSLKLDNDIEEKNTIVVNLNREIAELQSKKQITIERQKYEVDDAKLQSNMVQLKEEVLTIQNVFLLDIFNGKLFAWILIGLAAISLILVFIPFYRPSLSEIKNLSGLNCD